MEWITLLIVCSISILLVIYFDQRRYCKKCHRFVKLKTTIVEQTSKGNVLYKIEAICPKCGKILYSDFYWDYIEN